MAATLLLVEQCPCQPNPTLPNLKLEWPQVQGCPTGDEVRRAVAQHLGESSGHTNEVDATAVIEYRAGYQLVLLMRGSSGQDTRELNGETCQSVVDAAVVILAVTLGAEAGEHARNVELTSTVVAQSSLSVPPPTAVMPTVLRVSGNMKLTRRRFELPPNEMPNSLSRGIGLGVYVPFHIARSALLGVIASGHVVHSGWRLQGDFGWVPERKLGLASDSSRGAWVTLGLIALSAGPVIQRGVWEWIPRIGFAEQVLHGRGFGADATSSRWAYFPSARIGSVLQVHALSSLYMSAMLDFAVPFRRPALLIVPEGEVLRPAYLGLEAALCAGLHF